MTDNILKRNVYKNEKYVFLLIPIGIISYILRDFYFHPEILLTFDSLSYFFYASDISVLGQLPSNYSLANNFWPIFLSFFFQIFQFENTIQFMDLQKTISMILSTITIIPIYFLCRKFFEAKFALIGAIIFAFEPRLIQNSMLGITEPLYILLGAITIMLFLSSNKKLVYLSFFVAGLTSITRAEGQMIFFIISVMFFIRYRNEKLVIPKYLMAVGLFALIVIPMMLFQIEVHGNETIFGRTAGTITYHSQDPENTDGGSGIPFLQKGIENFPKYLAWNLIPIFIFFVPIGIFYLFKKFDFKKLTLILLGIGISIPAFYAYSIPLEDTRYLFMLYPIFCVISLFTIKKFSNYFKKKNFIIILIVIGIFSASVIFMELKPIDSDQKFEASLIAKDLIKEPKVMNSFYPEDHFLESAVLPDKWEKFKEFFTTERTDNKSIRSSISNPITIIQSSNYSSLDEFIEKNPELTHLYIDENKRQVKFLQEIFNNSNHYKFLIKEFDSKDFDYNYHVKIFRIEK